MYKYKCFQSFLAKFSDKLYYFILYYIHKICKIKNTHLFKMTFGNSLVIFKFLRNSLI